MTDVAAVAVVGMAGRFPGARDVGEYWENLRRGVCSISDFGEQELIADGADPAEVRRAGYVRAKGYLAGADRFEADLFGFNRTEAAALDPQHRLLLETTWAALEDAGYDPRGAPPRTGVYVGGSRTEHMLAAAVDRRLSADLGAMQLRTLTDREFLAPWISYRLGLTGPSMTVATACSTSLTAVHLAVQALLLGECDAALAGGVSLDSVRKRGYLYQEGGIFSPDGRCRPFDESSAGTVGGNGVGVVVLRRLDDAIADGDPIRAVIHGTAVTNDGSAKVGFTAPGVDRQSAAIVEAWSMAGLDPSAAQYLELHGTGTELGDRVELAAAAAAVGDAPGAPCGIGSVKSNIGHLDAAAGVASLIKVVLMLGHATMAPTANVVRPHPDLVGPHASLFRLVTAETSWDAPVVGPRLAGVSALGIGGTNVHVVVGEGPETTRSPVPDRVELLPLSARSDEQLAEVARRLAGVLRSAGGPALSDVAHTLRAGRAPLPVRGRVVAATAEAAADALEALADGSPTPARRDPAAPAGSAAGAGLGPTGEGAALWALGERWVRGEDVDWPASAAGARRVHLPTYPFAGQSWGSLALDDFAVPAPGEPAGDAGPAGNGGPGQHGGATSHGGARPAGSSRDGGASEPGGPPPGDGRPGRLTEAAVTELLAVSLGLAGPQDLESLYFGVGGDSLTAVHLVSRLHDDFGVDVPIELFLEPLTLRQLAGRIVAIADGADDALLAALLDEAESQG
jgi:acyl transferase domain-containing protein/acyl carrier protein